MQKIDLEKVLKNIVGTRIGIIGDFCLDVYWNIDKDKAELSLETKLPTKPVKSQLYSLGGAGNVANNLKAMGVRNVSVFGVTGHDPFGHQMRALMRANGIKHDNLLEQNDKWDTHVYIKPIENDGEGSRIDFGNYNNLSGDVAKKLLSCLGREIKSLDAVIINQQVPNGIHLSKTLQEGLQKLISDNRKKLFFLDSRSCSELYQGTIRKLNSYEASKLCGRNCEPDDVIAEEDAKSAGSKLSVKWKNTVFVTRGDRGCLVVENKKITVVPGLHIIEKTDPVGAGDSMLAGLSAAMAGGADPVTAATFGNFVAGVTVQKLYQTGTASAGEIRKIGTDADYIFTPEKADDIRSAKYYANSEIEIVREAICIGKISHAIFDHDGTISVLREGWEKIMEPMMMKAILGPVYAKADESTYHKVLNRVGKFIDSTTGIQTLVQMQGLVKLVKEFGFVPEKEVLDEFGYKSIYNEALLELVKKRVEKLKRGELNIDDFAIKGVVPFLHKLHESGISLYMASGSDESDVIEEAKALGYANLFEKRIYGAVGDVTKEAKKIVMDRIVKDIGAKNAKQIVAFGDGPVEIREINKRGGLAIGIASDEVRRFGLNQQKRSRLIRAGADIIIPDYSQADILSRILKI
jgi:rfaE bifunctional protein kinase chain/domain